MSRIISGRYGGLYIGNPKHKIRPTTGKVKEYIFNVLQNLEGRRVIDLFCGTGALGIEALSHNADHVTFVDNNSRSIQLSYSNLESIKAPENTWKCIKSDTLKFLLRDRKKYDIILADPPYDLVLNKEYFDHFREHLTDDGLVILEYSRRGIVESGEWEPSKIKKMGDTVVYIFNAS
ncbi:MAG: RsmD family RNA methyltransferase [Candidatus Marinimicrobia bacterium]|nr:RsmD family RNA methyltransferase [Candidatus Neomarinimicrobiota bacterium]